MQRTTSMPAVNMGMRLDLTEGVWKQEAEKNVCTRYGRSEKNAAESYITKTFVICIFTKMKWAIDKGEMVVCTAHTGQKWTAHRNMVVKIWKKISTWKTLAEGGKLLHSRYTEVPIKVADRLLELRVQTPPGTWICLLWVLCVVRYRSLRLANHSSRGILPIVVCPMSVIANPRKGRSWPGMGSKCCIKNYIHIYIYDYYVNVCLVCIWFSTGTTAFCENNNEVWVSTTAEYLLTNLTSMTFSERTTAWN
jgi:hypothetical protein